MENQQPSPRFFKGISQQDFNGTSLVIGKLIFVRVRLNTISAGIQPNIVSKNAKGNE